MFTVAVQMDAIATIHPETDTTLALMLEAQVRGMKLFYYTPERLSLKNGAVVAQAQPITVRDTLVDYYTLGESMALDLSSVDAVLLRQDPPFDMAYITTTYLLERLPKRVRVINNPASVRNNPEKLFPLRFPEFIPPTLVSSNSDAIRAFHREQKEIVLKPLYGFGGHSIFHIPENGGNLDALLEMAFAASKEPLIAQTYLPAVKTEEKRIVLIDGKIAGAMGRIPPEGEIRSNLRIGGKGVKTELTQRQQQICAAVGPVLKELGIVLAGLDVIGDTLIEINITSPTGLRVLKKLYGITPERDFWDAVFPNTGKSPA